MQPKNIDEYISVCPHEVQPILEKIRSTIRKAVPKAQETISYRMPTFTFHGVLLHFAAFKQHIGMYPPVRGDAALIDAVSRYANEKGNLRFPFARRIPYSLISRIAKARARENLDKMAAGKKRAR